MTHPPSPLIKMVLSRTKNWVNLGTSTYYKINSFYSPLQEA